MRFEAQEHFEVTPDALWSFLADTSRVNRVIGLQAVTFLHEPRADGGSRVTGEFRRFGILLARWTEHAFNFERPQRYSVLREYSVGPFSSLRTGVELTPEGRGTDVRVFAEVMPRNLVGRLLAKYVVGHASTRRLLVQCRQFEAFLLGRAPSAFPQLRPTRNEVDTRRLDELTGRLYGTDADPSVVVCLREYLLHEPDDRVGQMRPFALADAWNLDRYTTLVTFLHSTTVGLLDMRWAVLCPNCRVSKAEYLAMTELREQAHCETCNITFDTNFDRLVEVRFKVSPSVRDAGSGTFCIGGPQNRPHIVAQAELGPGESVVWTVPAEGGTYRLRSPQSDRAALVEIVEDGGEASPGPLHIGPDAVLPETLRVRATGRIQVVNDVPSTVIAELEEQIWANTAATAALVSTMQDFRDLCSAEVLAPGLQVGIERLALLFTDVAGSTELYERVGQARAFRVVQDHFGLVERVVRENRGAIVKTIGDAVMAVFPTGADALRAAIGMQRSMRELAGREGVDPARLLKVGIHSGPCLAVTLNDRLDYFGTTVNTAARTEHEAHGGEIVVTQEVRIELGVSEILNQEALGEQTMEVKLRGLAEPVRLFRIGSSTGWMDGS